MKLTMRKKIALLGVIFIIFLAIFLTIVFVNNRKNPSPTHQQKGQKSLSQAKQSVISEIKSQLNNKLDGVSNLLAEMKKEKMLKADEND
jgi:peptidoglycan hydrolase CwlO-like protein